MQVALRPDAKYVQKQVDTSKSVTSNKMGAGTGPALNGT